MITAMISKKGGVGKTTTTVNLAGALARTGQRVLLVDLDSQASASRSLGVPRAKLAPSIADVLFWGTPPREAVRPTEVENLDLITASADLVSADIDLGQSRQRETRLRSALEPLRESYDAILLDCSPSLSLLPINALTAADAFIAPVVPHFLAIEGVESLLKAAQRVRAYFNRDLECLGILMTMVDYRTNETRMNVERIRQQYGRMVFGVEIRINTRLAEAPGRGQTIFDYDPSATGAAAHSLLAVEYALRARALRRMASGEAPPAGPPGEVLTPAESSVAEASAPDSGTEPAAATEAGAQEMGATEARASETDAVEASPAETSPEAANAAESATGEEAPAEPDLAASNGAELGGQGTNPSAPALEAHDSDPAPGADERDPTLETDERDPALEASDGDSAPEADDAAPEADDPAAADRTRDSGDVGRAYF